MQNCALVAPIGQKSEVLDEGEHQTLTKCLKVIRKGGVMDDLLDDLLRSQDDGPEEAIASLAGTYLQECRETGNEVGILVDGFGENHGLWRLLDSELDILVPMITLIRRNEEGWFTAWLAAQAQRIAAAERFPSPLEIMGTLAVEMDEFAYQVGVARQFAEQRPDLLSAAPPAQPEAAPPETATSKPAKRQAARKAAR
jgi:hypothetical protein